MDWLQDIAEERKREEQQRQSEYLRLTRLLADEVQKADQMVTRLLNDLGVMYFGSHWLWGRKFKITRPNAWEWKLSDGGTIASGYFSVGLNVNTSPPHFSVTAGDGRIEAQDTSEAELRRALRLAAKQGLHFDSD